MFEVIAALAGLFLLVFRMRGGSPLWPQAEGFRPLAQEHPLKSAQDQPSGANGTLFPKVSIIVPARNESHNILPLLESLSRLDPPPFEVIVVDDQSEDDTFAKAQGFEREFAAQTSEERVSSLDRVSPRYFPIRVVRGAERPLDLPGDQSRSLSGAPRTKWNGKQWACHQGALAAQGDYLLFTDADTLHHPQSLGCAVSFAAQHGYDLTSALPYHQCDAWWDRLLGPFQVWLLAMTNPFGQPTPKRLYAIGQYLLFTQKAYQTCGGHEAVRDQLVEDIPLAQKVLEKNPQGYGVYTATALFRVKMYGSLAEFFRGWRRNFRAGFEMTSPWLGIDAFFYVSAITGSGHFLRAPGPTLVAMMAMGLLVWQQRRLGRFSALGPLLFPVSLTMFCAVALCALFDKIFRRDQKWKGRQHNPFVLADS